ncbi:hypothetical protein MRX96_010662 [Rhipicephalus microplus]
MAFTRLSLLRRSNGSNTVPLGFRLPDDAFLRPQGSRLVLADRPGVEGAGTVFFLRVCTLAALTTPLENSYFSAHP